MLADSQQLVVSTFLRGHGPRYASLTSSSPSKPVRPLLDKLHPLYRCGIQLCQTHRPSPDLSPEGEGLINRHYCIIPLSRGASDGVENAGFGSCARGPVACFGERTRALGPGNPR